jgi:hypothetical protein
VSIGTSCAAEATQHQIQHCAGGRARGIRRSRRRGERKAPQTRQHASAEIERLRQRSRSPGFERQAGREAAESLDEAVVAIAARLGSRSFHGSAEPGPAF